MDNPEIRKDGSKRWYDSDGELHRDDGPAIESANGSKWWYQHGYIHRDDGPAVEYTSGTKLWCLGHTLLSFGEWLDKGAISGEAKVMMKLKYG
jgi:hypothetical protein